MNWLKNAIENNWANDAFYHLSNTIQFEVDNYPRLTLAGPGVETPTKMDFNIMRDDNNEYLITFRRTGESGINAIVTSDREKMIHSNTYETLRMSPQAIIENCLSAINDNLREDLGNGMV